MQEAIEAARRIVAVDEGEPGSDDDVGYVDTVLVARALLSSPRVEELRELLQFALPIVRASDYANLADDISRALSPPQG